MNTIIRNINKQANEDEIFEKAYKFLELPVHELTETSLVRRFRELCLIKMFYSIGMRNMYNSKNRFFGFVSLVLGQAVSDVLGLSLEIAPDYLRLIRYDGINFVNRIKEFLQTEDIEKAMIDAFDLCDDNVKIVNSIEFEF